jgi:hypothetical protein
MTEVCSMQSEEQRLIDGLFSRLKEAESHSASRDASAEERIAGHIKEQPFAPYYMAQTILIQEAAIKQLNDRIQALEPGHPASGREAEQRRVSLRPVWRRSVARFRPDSWRRAVWPTAGRRPASVCSAGAAAELRPQASRSGGGFMAGALQTAAGVAGGVVLGNMLTNMFSGSHPQEIVNIIEEKPQPDLSQAQDNSVADDTFRQDDGQFLADNNDYDADFDAGFGNDDFGSDDDSWV